MKKPEGGAEKSIDRMRQAYTRLELQRRFRAMMDHDVPEEFLKRCDRALLTLEKAHNKLPR